MKRLISLILLGLLAIGLVLILSVEASSFVLNAQPTEVSLAPGDISQLGGKYYIGLGTGDNAILGDLVSPTFLSTIELYRWGAECKVKLGLGLTGGTATYDSVNKIITWNSRTADRRRVKVFYDKTTDSLEFDIILLVKPSTNIQTLTLSSDNLVYYYQPPLTQEYIPGWDGGFQCNISVNETNVWNYDTGEVLVERPINVVGSYAVYHSQPKGIYTNQADADKYKSGKAFHWYRPLVYDSSIPRKETWGILNIQTGQRTVTIDQNFLNTATYPVTIDDEFGYHSTGTPASTLTIEGRIIGLLDTFSGAGTGVSISAYLSGTGSTQTYKFGLYDGTNFIDNGTTNEGVFDATAGWHTLDFTIAPTLEASKVYAIVAWSNAASLSCLLGYDGTAGYTQKFVAATYGAWPDPVTWSADISDRRSLIYCTYTPSGGAAFIPKVVIY